MLWYDYLIIVGFGLIAGFINTMAGGGSLLVLPLLISYGIPPTIANGTNRVAILLQNVSGVIAFKRKKVIKITDEIRLIIPAIIGGAVGAFLAVDINEALLQKVIGIVLIVMLFSLLFNPFKAKDDQLRKARIPYWLQVIIYFSVGVYGGFIQAGVGFFLIAALTFGSGYNLVKTNALKLLIVFFYTLIALAIFIINDQVNFLIGLVLAIGNMTGAWIAANISVKHGAGFVRWILVVALAVFAVKMLFF